MEEYSDRISSFVRVFENLPKFARQEAIKQLIDTLDAEDMNILIEVIDTKLDKTATNGIAFMNHEEEDNTMVDENDTESEISDLNPSDEICDKEEVANGFHSDSGDIAGMFYPSVQIEESSQSFKDSQMYQCPVSFCEFETKWTSYLKTHMKTIHSSKKLKCNQCDYMTTTKSSLLKHISTMHGVDRYPCSKCDYKATQKANLQRHIDSVHEGIRHQCEYCNYSATRKDHLSRHVKQHHSSDS